MSIIRWKPFEELDKIFENTRSFYHNSWDLAADVYEENNNIIVEMHVPGIKPDKIDIEVENTHLHVSGSREEKEEVKDAQYYHKEIRCGSFDRVIQLPSSVIADQTRAEFKDGVLKILLPKKSIPESKKIKITKT